jgi:hypothetical protein
MLYTLIASVTLIKADTLFSFGELYFLLFGDHLPTKAVRADQDVHMALVLVFA